MRVDPRCFAVFVGTLFLAGCASHSQAPPPVRVEGSDVVAVGTIQGAATGQAAREAARSAAVGHLLRRIGVQVSASATYRTEGVKTGDEARVTFRSRERTEERTPELAFRKMRIEEVRVSGGEAGFDARVAIRVPQAEVERHRRRRRALSEEVATALGEARTAAERGDWPAMMAAIHRGLQARARYRARFLAGPHDDLAASVAQLLDRLAIRRAGDGPIRAGAAEAVLTLVVAFEGEEGAVSPLQGVPLRVTLPSGRTVSGVTEPNGRARLTLPPPYHPGRYHLKAAARPDWRESGGQEWAWAGEGPAPASARVALQVDGPDGLAQGRFHPYIEVEGAGWARVKASPSTAKRRARQAAVIDAQAKLVEDATVTQTASVADNRLARQTTQRQVAGEVPDGVSVVEEAYKRSGGRLRATVVLCRPLSLD